MAKRQLPVLLIMILLILGASNGCARITPYIEPRATLQALESSPTKVATLLSMNTPVSSSTVFPAPTKTFTKESTKESEHDLNYIKRDRTTPVPPGVFLLMFYPPLVMDYDISIWRDESQYSNREFMINYLQAQSLETCTIGVIGPSGFFPSPDEIVQLGKVRYQVKKYQDVPKGFVTTYYFEDHSLTGYNYDIGISVLTVKASSVEWIECKTMAGEVLATLRSP